MGVSTSKLDNSDDDSYAQLLSIFGHRKQTIIPLLPRDSIGSIEYIPTCNHSHMQDLSRSAVMPYGTAPIGGGMAGMPGMENFMPQRRGYMGGGPGTEHNGQDINIFGHCREMAHPGPCRVGPQSNQEWSRPRRMRGGGRGDFRQEAQDFLSNFMRHNSTPHMYGGCGPTCAVNDGSFRVRGRVDDRDVDLKLGGMPACPCADYGGCEATKRRMQSRSRSRNRRERRARKSRKCETEIDAASSDGERGRARKRASSRDAEERLAKSEETIKKLEELVEKFTSAVSEIKEAQYMPMPPPQPDLGPIPPNARPYYGPEYPTRPPGFDAMPPRRPGWGRGMTDDFGMGRAGMPPGPYGLGRMPRSSPLDADLDAAFDRRGAFDLGDGLDARRARPGLRRMDTDPLDDWADIPELDDELPIRGIGLRGRRGSKFKTRGFATKRPGFPRRPTRDLFGDATMFGGLEKPGDNEDEGEELSFSGKLRDGSVRSEKVESNKKASAESAQCSPAPVEKEQSRSSKHSKPRGRAEHRKAGYS